MPNLPLNFDSYPVTTILDGNGNGYISFQPNGSNISVSRLFVQVSTSAKQASVTLYKGGMNATNAIGTIVSGSTGGLASGQIFLTDGQMLYVSWTGGDAGATATATFSGKQISLDQIGTDSITWTDPIAASDGSLVFPAIKSPNFVTGSAGWNVSRDGTAEFNNVTVRGNLVTTGSNNSYVKIVNNNGNSEIDFYPGDPGTGYTVPAVGNITSNFNTFNAPADVYSTLSLESPIIKSTTGSLPKSAALLLQSESTDLLTRELIGVFGDLDVTGTYQVIIENGDLNMNGVSLGRGIQTPVASSTSNSGNIGTTATAVLTILGFTFLAGRAYAIRMIGGVNSSASGTGADFRVFKSTSGTLGVEFGEYYRTVCALGNSVVPANGEIHVKNATGSNIVTDVALTLASTSSAATVSHQAGSGRQRLFFIEDIGSASSTAFANATQVS